MTFAKPNLALLEKKHTVSNYNSLQAVESVSERSVHEASGNWQVHFVCLLPPKLCAGISVVSNRYKHSHWEHHGMDQAKDIGYICRTLLLQVDWGRGWSRPVAQLSSFCRSSQFTHNRPRGFFLWGLSRWSTRIHTRQVSKHATMKDRVWVAYRHGVYDITDFIQEHPGGDKILMGAGGSVEPFWACMPFIEPACARVVREDFTVQD
ncbi:uncharacterized protein LOC119590494 [Penaeus monodon]|uniref:uncharacterized protein LOC119590494 n=1 Tax=Penaeus monodon TaxID=6687 RepID=UPI0018A75801|nr:uncharacterized protein LOC119590494 [Penaeus monodon]